jgi:hypothetical protein
MKQTIAQQINWDFETNGSLIIRDKNGNLIYLEYSCGYWAKSEYDSKGNITHYQNSNGDWAKWEWDSQGKKIYFETSAGTIIDNRPKSCENKIVEIDGEKFKLVKV